MTNTELAAFVSEALALDQEIAAKTDELKEMKLTLIAEAERRPDGWTETEGGGKSLLLDGVEGSVARITFPAAALKSIIRPEGKLFEKIKGAAGKCFDKLFTRSAVFVLVDNFRDEAKNLLAGSAGRLIKLCETDPSPKVSFETKANS